MKLVATSIAMRRLAGPIVLILLGFVGTMITVPTPIADPESDPLLALKPGSAHVVFLFLLAAGSIWSGFRLWQLARREDEACNGRCRFCGASMIQSSKGPSSSRRCRLCGLRRHVHL